MKRALRWVAIAAAAGVLGAVAAAAFMPVSYDSREELFEIPNGTWARRMSGSKVDIIPDEIFLMVRVRDILVLKNLDDVPQIFGPTLIMPGQTFKLPFEVASEYQFACTAHASGTMTVFVDEEPNSPLQRLAWRTGRLVKSVL